MLGAVFLARSEGWGWRAILGRSSGRVRLARWTVARDKPRSDAIALSDLVGFAAIAMNGDPSKHEIAAAREIGALSNGYVEKMYR
jgi:hypothetical protein